MANQYEQLARLIAQQAGISPEVFTAQIRQESGFNPEAHSSAGAMGIAQIVPKWHPGVDPMDPKAALTYAANWDAQLLKKYGGDWRQVLSVYNSGQPEKYKDPNFSGGQTYNYVRSILGDKSPRAQLPAAPTGPTPSSPARPQAMPAAPAAPATPAPIDSVRSALLSSLMGQNDAFAKGETASSPSWMDSILPELIQNQQQPNPILPALAAAPQNANPVHPAVALAAQHAASPKAAGIIKAASKWIGTPYSWGGGGPGGPSKGIEQGANTVGFDCSGLLQYAAAQQGISIGGDTYSQWKQGQPVDRKNLKPGDAVFFHPGRNGPEHVGIYMGQGKYIQAPHTGDVVKISALADANEFMGGRRYA